MRKEGHKFLAPTPGEGITSGTEELLTCVEAEHKLRDIFHQFPDVRNYTNKTQNPLSSLDLRQTSSY